MSQLWSCVRAIGLWGCGLALSSHGAGKGCLCVPPPSDERREAQVNSGCGVRPGSQAPGSWAEPVPERPIMAGHRVDLSVTGPVGPQVVPLLGQHVVLMRCVSSGPSLLLPTVSVLLRCNSSSLATHLRSEVRLNLTKTEVLAVASCIWFPASSVEPCPVDWFAFPGIFCKWSYTLLCWALSPATVILRLRPRPHPGWHITRQAQSRPSGSSSASACWSADGPLGRSQFGECSCLSVGVRSLGGQGVRFSRACDHPRLSPSAVEWL